MKRNILDIESALRKSLEREKHVAAAFLFGSFGTPHFGSESDLDVGVLFAAQDVPGPLELLELQERLSSAVGLTVDVVCMNSASPIICRQILLKGSKIVDRDPKFMESFFVRTVMKYADLKRVRRPIEERILAGRQFSST